MQLRTRTGIIINLIVLILISIFFVRECCETKDLPVIRKLDQHWMFHMAGENRQYPAKTPGLVHLDLFENALIPEPFFASNEDSLQWIGEKSWIYETYFNASREMLQKKNIHFVFEGLDTFADVFLNDELILQADNMFVSWEIPIKDKLKTDSNFLRLIFYPPGKLIEKRQKEYGIQLPQARGFVRKAPYQFGWDWGPRFLTAGIWKDIQILAWNDARIEDVFIEQDYVGKDSARISARVEIESSVFAEAAIEIEVKGKPNRKAKQKINLIPGGNIARISFSMPDPQRWWPNGMGDPYLYDYMVKLHLKEILLDENSGRIGLRDIRVVNAPDSIGESFYVEVNGQQLFIQGANYIPQDNFLTRVRNQDYKKLIKDAAQSNMNMLRVWGGGVYEKDIFYDLCDEYGLLVWQDFMFACNMYPGNKEFLVSIEKEAEQNVKRLRNHACIALWCGNNEVDEGWKNWGWQKQLGYSFADSIIVRQAYHDIFDSILPAVIHQYDPATFYWPSSPEYGWGHEESMTHGDSHYWGVWWGVEPFETYREKVPRFMSEFGFQAFPSLAAIDSFAEPKNQHLDSKAMKTHQKHPRGFELIDLYMQRDFPIPGDFNAYVYMSQLLQAHGIGMAIEAQRQAKPRCMGSLYWQFNDCWPVISWSSRDYYGNWKALQYRVQDLYKNVVLIAGSTEDEIELSVLNDSQEKLQVTIHMRIQDFGEKIYFDSLFKCTVESLGKTAFIFIRDCIMPTRGECKLVLITELRDKKGRMLDSDFHYFCKPGQLFLEPVQFKTEIKKIREGYLIRLEGNHLAKCVFLQFEGHTGHFTKNFFDLPAGHNYTTRYLTEERINDPKENLKIICLNEFVNGKPLGRKRVHLNKY